nr:hypothetical protein Iba_chr07aCG14470 [Ipomoea batatas]GMD35132.1 hypothetical protein Iba_chr09dCG4030 [Ipomoea batatas]
MLVGIELGLQELGSGSVESSLNRILNAVYGYSIQDKEAEMEDAPQLKDALGAIFADWIESQSLRGEPAKHSQG